MKDLKEVRESHRWYDYLWGPLLFWIVLVLIFVVAMTEWGGLIIAIVGLVGVLGFGGILATWIVAHQGAKAIRKRRREKRLRDLKRKVGKV